MGDRMVSAQAVVDALSAGEPVYEGTRPYAVLKRLRLLDLLPPWYSVEFRDEDGWEVYDDDCPTLADAQKAVRQAQADDVRPRQAYAPHIRHREKPAEYAERIRKWAEEESQAAPLTPRKYRIREYAYGKRPRTVTTEKRG